MASIRVKVILLRTIYSTKDHRGAVIMGEDVPYEALTVGDVDESRIAETAAHLSRLLGMHVRIETAE